jgi:hypothetical protein
MRRWRGLKDLVVDAVHHGSAAVEQVHLRTAVKPFEIIARVPLVAAPARRASAAQSAMIASTYATIRAVNRVVGSVADVLLDIASRRGEQRAGSAPGEPGTAEPSGAPARDER